MKDLLDNYSATTRQILNDYLKLKVDVHNEYVQKNNSIPARAQTPNSRRRSIEGPNTTVYKKKKKKK